MREYLRRTADEGWIIDLSPEGHQPEVNTRVFPGVQHPLCIGIFARYGEGNPDEACEHSPRHCHGLARHKFARLERLSLASSRLGMCAAGWRTASSRPERDAWLDYRSAR